MRPFRVELSGFDHCPPWVTQLPPLRGSVVKRFLGDDRDDYMLVKLDRPFRYPALEGADPVDHVVISTRHVGARLGPHCGEVAISVAFVMDRELSEQQRLLFSQVHYVAVASAKCSPTRGRKSKEARVRNPDTEKRPGHGEGVSQSVTNAAGD